MSRRNLLSRKNTTPVQKSRIVFKTDSYGSVNINVIGKGNKQRMVPMGKEAVRLLKKYIQL